jgi:hypothetical protein
VRQRGSAVRAFYASNVSVYLTNQQSKAFCANLAALPTATGTSFIERDSVRPLGTRLKACQ